jgi:hypothetical protein
MRGRCLTIAVLLAATSVQAQTSYNGATVGVELVGGGRGGSGSDDSVLGGGRFLLGWRQSSLRFGAEGGLIYSRSFDSSLSIDAGGYVSGDLFSVWLDPYLSLAVITRLDLLARSVPTVGAVGFLPEASIGVRVLGFTFLLVAGPEIGLALVQGAEKLGGTGEARIGVDFVELCQLVKHLNAEKTPLPR